MFGKSQLSFILHLPLVIDPICFISCYPPPTSDNGPHDDSLTSDQLLDGIRLLTKALKQAFPVDEVYLLPVLGNHDVIPANDMEVTVNSPSRTAWCHQLGEEKDLWGEWINHRQKHLMSSISQQNSSKYPTANFSQSKYLCFY
ncbi:unnamed protein product [Trichobilharzia szidati]|nr:unnamed protein product [Trichobilharzia szidati]